MTSAASRIGRSAKPAFQNVSIASGPAAKGELSLISPGLRVALFMVPTSLSDMNRSFDGRSTGLTMP